MHILLKWVYSFLFKETTHKFFKFYFGKQFKWLFGFLAKV